MPVNVYMCERSNVYMGEDVTKREQWQQLSDGCLCETDKEVKTDGIRIFVYV